MIWQHLESSAHLVCDGIWERAGLILVTSTPSSWVIFYEAVTLAKQAPWPANVSHFYRLCLFYRFVLLQRAAISFEEIFSNHVSSSATQRRGPGSGQDASLSKGVVGNLTTLGAGFSGRWYQAREQLSRLWEENWRCAKDHVFLQCLPSRVPPPRIPERYTSAVDR